MKYNQKFGLLFSLSLPLFFFNCDKTENVVFEAQDLFEVENEDHSFRDTIPQVEAVPVFDVAIREAICLQGGKRLEAVVRNFSGRADLYTYHFQWKVDGILQVEGALLPCQIGHLAEVAVTRYPDQLVVVRQLELGDDTEEAELLYDVH